MGCSPPGSSVHADSPGKNWNGLPQPPLGGLLHPGIKQGLLYCRWILYRLRHRGSSRILEWVAYPFSRGTYQPRNQTRVSCIAGRFFTSSATREAHKTRISRNNFSGLRFLHLLIHRKALKSLSWDVWIFVISSNLMMFSYIFFFPQQKKLVYILAPHLLLQNSLFRATWEAVSWV